MNNEQIEKLEHGLMICEATGTKLVHIGKEDAEKILGLLKKQEAAKPILKREGRNKYYNDYVCPRCDNEVVYEQNYCSECGVKFMWVRR